jgi:dolichol-phosphate mannosyltransferase
MDFSLVIPCFNEEKNITNLFREINDSLINFNYELIFIDDCSTDNSLKSISNLKKLNKNIVVIKNKKNKGQSYCIYEGIKISKSNTIVTLDCDGQNNPKDIPKLLELFFEEEDIYLIGGLRKKRKDSFIKILSSKFANFFRNLILHDECPDTGCSLKIFDKKIFLNFPFFDGIHRFIPALFKGMDKKAIYVNVDHRKRLHGISKYGTFKRALNGIYDIFKVLQIIKKIKNDKLLNKSY